MERPNETFRLLTVLLPLCETVRQPTTMSPSQRRLHPKLSFYNFQSPVKTKIVYLIFLCLNGRVNRVGFRTFLCPLLSRVRSPVLRYFRLLGTPSGHWRAVWWSSFTDPYPSPLLLLPSEGLDSSGSVTHKCSVSLSVVFRPFLFWGLKTPPRQTHD